MSDPFMTPLVACTLRVDDDLVDVVPGRDRWRRSRVRELGCEHLFELAPQAPARAQRSSMELRAYGPGGGLLGEERGY